jgi:ABC-type bacteriocin/lantibiotic exporter with double-glycine peptidase domain
MNINVIKQYDNESCGPACMTMILNAFGKNVTERQIDDQIRAHKNEGLSPSRLLDGARMNGANGTILNNSNFAEIRENLDANNQMIAFVRNNSGGSHFVVISGYTVSDDGEISLEISDPWTGRKSTMDYDKFERDYWTNIPDGSRDSGFDKCIIVFSDRNTLPQQRLSGKAFETDSRWYQMNTRPLAA